MMCSHPFIERLIGTIRRECLDRLLFWTGTDLEATLTAFKGYYKEYRTHSALNGKTPVESGHTKASISNRMDGNSTVAVYTRRQWPRNCEFARHTS
jgi:hypothetical protein